MKVTAFIKQNSLFLSMAIGALVYELFAHIRVLEPVGRIMGPLLTDWLPIGLFLLLYATFCKINISEMKPGTSSFSWFVHPWQPLWCY